MIDAKVIKISCEAKETVDLDELVEFQGDLAKLTNDNFLRLEAAFLKHGITFAVSVWYHDGARWFGPNNEVNVWEINTDFNGDYIHPTQKPTALARRAFNNSSKPGEIVLELFCGSGSTLIACEQTGRICCAMERDPAYIDVEVERYCRFTGKNRVLLNGKEVEWQLTEATADRKLA